MTAARREAPRVGYLLTSAMAGRRYEEASAIWRELDESAQCDVITALASQARQAVREAGIPLQIDFSGLADTSCTEARACAQAAYEETGPWQPPPWPRYSCRPRSPPGCRRPTSISSAGERRSAAPPDAATARRRRRVTR